MSLRHRILSAVVSAALLALATPAQPATPEPTRGEQLEQGAVLEALVDVELRGATLARGAKVQVVAIERRGVAPVAASLLLADGYVMRGVALSRLVGKFRIRRER